MAVWSQTMPQTYEENTAAEFAAGERAFFRSRRSTLHRSTKTRARERERFVRSHAILVFFFFSSLHFFLRAHASKRKSARYQRTNSTTTTTTQPRKMWFYFLLRASLTAPWYSSFSKQTDEDEAQRATNDGDGDFAKKKKKNNNNNNTTKFSAGGGGGFQQQQGQNETRARNTKQLSLVDAWKRRDNAGAPSPSPSPSLAPRKKPKTTVATSSSSSSLSKKSGTKSEFVRGLAMKARPLSSHAHPLSTSFSSSSSSSLRMTTTQTTTPSKAKRRTAKPPTSTFTTPDDDESDANISGIAFKSLVSKWNDASVSEREELLKKITGCDPLQLKYDEKEVIDFLTFSIEIDKIIHRQQYLNDESWFRWVQERQNFHDTCEEIHLNSSRYIKREIAKQLLEERHRLGDALFWQAMGDEDSFLSHNTHWLIVVERGAPEKTRTLRASEYTDIMMEKGRENIVESTILNGCMAGLHQQGLVQSDPKGGCCTTKFALFDLFYCTAEQAFFNENENIQYVLFSCSDLLASIGPKHWKANNEGFIPRDEVIDLHVRGEAQTRVRGNRR